MFATVRLLVVALVATNLLLSEACLVVAADPAVQPARYEASAPVNDSAEVVRFFQQPTKMGSRVLQEVGIDFEIHSTIVQSGQIANRSTTTIRRRQQRLIEALGIAEGRVRRARVSFPESRIMSPENSDPGTEVAQAVEGKSYLVTRNGEQLLITDMDGVLPSQEEYEIVLGSVQTLGLPNPLTKFLTRRTLRVGDRLKLPTEIANRMMGFGDQLGQVEQFELELKELRPIDGQRCAVFHAMIAIRGGLDDPTSVDVEGQVVIETATCRTVAANFAGPLKMNATDTHYQYLAEGRVQVGIRSRYGIAVK